MGRHFLLPPLPPPVLQGDEDGECETHAARVQAHSTKALRRAYLVLHHAGHVSPALVLAAVRLAPSAPAAAHRTNTARARARARARAPSTDAAPSQEMDPYADPNAAYGGMYQSAHGAPPQGGPRQGMHYNQGHQPYLQGPPPDHMRGGYSMGYDDRGYSMRGGPMDHMGSGRKSRGGRGSGRSPNGQRGGMAMQHR